MKEANNILLETEHIKKVFGEHEVLKDINLSISKGNVIAIIGPSGCGKSTFLRMLNLLERPSSGRVLLEGVDITSPEIDINKMRERIGMVFQQFNLFPNMTIRQNIMLAPVQLKKMSIEEASQKADELLLRIGLADKADAYPDVLSGGQKQRIAIVRALAMNPDIMLFDEPTSGLDAINMERLAGALRLAAEEGAAIAVVTHDQEFIDSCATHFYRQKSPREQIPIERNNA